jgi:hypothetical protein
MGISVYFECGGCKYRSEILDLGMSLIKDTHHHPFIPCVCTNCKEFKLHQASSITWETNPTFAWVNRVGNPICDICGSRLEAFEILKIYVFITPIEVLKNDSDLKFYRDGLKKLLSSLFTCVKCGCDEMRIYHCGSHD